MKAIATPLIIAALMATHAYAAECGDKRMLRARDAPMESLLADAVVMGASTQSKNRMVVVSTDKDDAAIMSTMKKTTVRGDEGEAEKEARTRTTMSDDAMPVAVSMVLTKDTMRVQSDATKDSATMTKIGATVVKADNSQKSDDTATDKDRR